MTRLLFVVALAAIAAGCSSTPPEKAAAAEAPPIAVTVARVETSDLPLTFEAGGIVRARSSAAMASRIMAPIADIRVRPGDRVRRGQPLVTLDAREIRANTARAAAALSAAEEAARAAGSDTAAADAGLRLARATHERIAGLHAKQSATAQELDQAASALSAAEAQAAGARARAAGASATRDAARSAAEAGSITESYAVLSAPFDGVVTERAVDPGAMALPGVPLLTVEDANAFRLEVRIDEARASHVQVGSPVEIRLDDPAGASDGWTGARVVEAARVDSASHTLLIKIDVPARPGLRSGLFGRARFAGPATRALTVPAAALVRRGQLMFVYTVDAEDRARLRPITTGPSAAARVEALAGVHDGERVVTNPPSSLTDGSRVTPGEAR